MKQEQHRRREGGREVEKGNSRRKEWENFKAGFRERRINSEGAEGKLVIGKLFVNIAEGIGREPVKKAIRNHMEGGKHHWKEGVIIKHFKNGINQKEGKDAKPLERGKGY